MEKKLKYPELEQGNYEAQAEAQIAEARRQAELQEKRAKRDRDMAVLGDIANLVSKGAAMHGGAWKINKDEPMAAQGNAKLRALQESNSKQLVEYAKMRMNAADADRKERNAQKVAEYNAGVEQHKRDVEAQKYANEQAYKARKEAREVAESTAKIARDEAYANYYNNGGRSGSGNTGNKEKFVINGKEYTDVRVAYANLPPEAKARTRKITEYDRDGHPRYHETETVVDPNATLEQKIQAVRDFEYTQAQSNSNTPPSRRNNNNNNTPPSRR